MKYGSYGSWKTWKVLEFKFSVAFSRTGNFWESALGPGKCWKSVKRQFKPGQSEGVVYTVCEAKANVKKLSTLKWKLPYLTNRFHVAVHLSSNRSQRTSKFGKNIWHTQLSPRLPPFYSYHILTSYVIYNWTDARQQGIYFSLTCGLSIFFCC